MLRPAVVDGAELWGRRQVQADSIKRVALTQVLEGKILLCLRDWELPLVLEGRQVRQFPIPLTPQRQAQRLEDTSPVLQYQCPLPGAHKKDAHRPREGCRHGEAETPASWSHLSWGWSCAGLGVGLSPSAESHWGLPTAWH